MIGMGKREREGEEIGLYGMYCIVYTYTILVVAAHHFIGVGEDDGMISGGDGGCC